MLPHTIGLNGAFLLSGSEVLLLGILFIGLIASAVTDVKHGKIPNKITFPLVGAGFLFHLFQDGVSGFLFSLAGFAVGLGLPLIFYIRGGMGGGDVKLFASVGALVGPVDVCIGILFSALLGGLYAVGMMVYHMGWSQTAERINVLLLSLVCFRMNVAEDTSTSSLPRLRYALVIGLGSIAAQAYRWVGAV